MTIKKPHILSLYIPIHPPKNPINSLTLPSE
jgi:hypothetical protein